MASRTTDSLGARVVEAITHNFPLKVLSLALSIVLFSIVHSDQDAQRTVFLDVVALLPDPGADRMLLTDLPHEVKVTLRGSRARINALHRDDFRPITMDLTDTNRRFYYFDHQAVELDGNIQVVTIEPSSIVLEWATAAERRVPIKLRLDGEPASDIAVQEPVELTPAAVTIRGPAASVDGISAVFTDVISVEGLPGGVHERRVALEPLPEHVSYMEDVSVQVAMRLQAKLVERTIRRLEVAVVGSSEVSLRPANVSVTVRGPAKRVEQLDAEHVVPMVTLPEGDAIGPEAQVTIRNDAIDGLEVVRIAPPTVLVRRKR